MGNALSALFSPSLVGFALSQHTSTIDHILALRVLKANEGWWDEYWEDQRLRWGHRARDLAEGRPRVTY